MNRDRIITQLRGFHYAAGILCNQQNDPLCCQCTAFARVAESIIDGFLQFAGAHAAERKKLPEEFALLFQDVRDRTDSIQQPDDPIKQKTAGNCTLPKGVCFTKEISAFLERMQNGS
ncbi:MAG: hypothetical protein U0411_14685 [Thermodesulfovibrionales bacterium]